MHPITEIAVAAALLVMAVSAGSYVWIELQERKRERDYEAKRELERNGPRVGGGKKRRR